jgi:hypothetical protein
MCEGDPPLLSLGRLAELWRVIRMCEGGFERRGASAGVLGETALPQLDPAGAGSADFGLGKASRTGVG